MNFQFDLPPYTGGNIGLVGAIIVLALALIAFIYRIVAMLIAAKTGRDLRITSWSLSFQLPHQSATNEPSTTIRTGKRTKPESR